MDIKSCNINTRHYCIWVDDSRFSVEDLERGQKVLSSRMMEWFVENLSNMIKDQVQAFFLDKTRNGRGISRPAKFCSKEEWLVECAFWPSSGGKKNIHIPTGRNKQGWLSLNRAFSGIATAKVRS